MKSKKKIVIVIGIILVICLLVCGYLFKDKIFGNKSDKLKTTWGETYYLYLKDINENKLYDKAGLPSDVKDAKVSIININDIKEPVMTISYNKEDNNYTNVYYIEDDKVNALVYNEPTSVELLYNIEKDTYNYYSNTVSDDSNYYKNLTDQINSKTNKDSSKAVMVEEYVFNENDKETVTDSTGKEVTLTKFEETFIKVDTKDNSFTFDSKLVENELKKRVEKSIEIYEDISKVIEANKKATDKLKEELKAKQDSIKSIKEENVRIEEEKQKQIEEEKKQESEGIKLGNYTIKYGTYIGEAASEGYTLVLNKDGSCTYNGSACTYTIGTHDFAQDISTKGSYKTCLIISYDYTDFLFAYNNTTIGDGDLNLFTYSG